MYTKIILSNFVLLRVIACSKFLVFKIVAFLFQSFHHGLNTFPDMLCISLFKLTKYKTKSFEGINYSVTFRVTVLQFI
jgi:hypothetical protein